MGASFVPVAGEEYDIQTIKPVAPADAEDTTLGGWKYWIYELSDGGAASDSYVYLTVDDDSVEKDGWYSGEDGETWIVRTFKQGEGLVFDVDFDGAGMQTAGEVKMGEVVTPAVYGYCAMCNPYPVKISIQDITPVPPAEAEDTTLGGWKYWIYELSDGGAAADSYVYLTVDDDSVEKDGWYSGEDGETFIDERFYEPGDGLVFDVDFEGAGAAFNKTL